MPKSLRELKDHIRTQYLGRCGIHGLGISEKRDAITVHVAPRKNNDQESVLHEIRQSIAPHGLIVVEEDPPTFSA
jgi:hypothetical protein